MQNLCRIFCPKTRCWFGGYVPSPLCSTAVFEGLPHQPSSIFFPAMFLCPKPILSGRSTGAADSRQGPCHSIIVVIGILLSDTVFFWESICQLNQYISTKIEMAMLPKSDSSCSSFPTPPQYRPTWRQWRRNEAESGGWLLHQTQISLKYFSSWRAWRKK